MSGDIEVQEGTADLHAEVVITESRPQGWLAFYRYGAGSFWCQVYEKAGKFQRDGYRCPYPLFPTREDAIESARHVLPNGGEVRLVRVTL